MVYLNYYVPYTIFLGVRRPKWRYESCRYGYKSWSENGLIAYHYDGKRWTLSREPKENYHDIATCEGVAAYSFNKAKSGDVYILWERPNSWKDRDKEERFESSDVFFI